ncbi:hypothetical protein SORBI_3001G008000 [Sorghum bicolor]|uniref:Pentatricopeptide repeat-containing protein n=1 Tax=Sorghum bicolor TaxID=4558 RepID=A0A1B6QGU2_SORBI|nr:hypothetical protein SORBI_3001G008000 [Sorghum bicolor]
MESLATSIACGWQRVEGWGVSIANDGTYMARRKIRIARGTGRHARSGFCRAIRGSAIMSSLLSHLRSRSKCKLQIQNCWLFPAAGPTLLSVARSLAVASPPPSAASVLGFLCRLPHDASPHIFPHLVAALARSPHPILALRLFLSPPTSAATTHHSFNSALLRFPLPPHLLPAFFSHSLRRFPGLTPTLLSFNLLLKCICSSMVPRNPGLYLAIALGILHDVIPAWNLVPDKFTYSTVVSALADAGWVEDAVALVHEMVVDGVVSAEAFNPVLRAMLRAGDVNGAAKLFRFMQLKGCTLTAVTYNVLLHGLLLCGKARAAMNIMRRMENEGIVPGLMTYGAVVDGLVKCGRVEDAWKVAQEMGRKGLAPSEFVFSAVIAGFCKSGEVDRALMVWEAMVAARVKPNVVLYSAMIDGFARSGRMTEAEMLFEEMVDAKCIPNIMTYSSMTRGYFHIGNSSRALSTWEEMIKDGMCKLCSNLQNASYVDIQHSGSLSIFIPDDCQNARVTCRACRGKPMQNTNQRRSNDDDKPVMYLKLEDENFHELSSWSFTFPIHSERSAQHEMKNYKEMGLVMAIKATLFQSSERSWRIWCPNNPERN